MKKFNLNDVIFARATMMGHELINLRLSGIGSMSELLRRVRQELGSYIGMINLVVRNISQGWTSTAAFRVA